MKITYYKDDKSYSIEYSCDVTWLRTQYGDGFGMNEKDLGKLHHAIFYAIDDFYNKHM